MTASLCAVAGCLFEVHLPQPADEDGWEWTTSDEEVVTLLARPDPARFRFRAEQPGDVTLSFRCSSAVSERLTLHITPEGIGDGIGERFGS